MTHWSAVTGRLAGGLRMPLEGGTEVEELGAASVLRAFRQFSRGVLRRRLGSGTEAIAVNAALDRLTAMGSVLGPLLGSHGLVELELILAEAKRLLLVNVRSKDEPLEAAVERTLEEAVDRISAMATRRNHRLASAGLSSQRQWALLSSGRWQLPDSLLTGIRLTA